MEGHRESTVRGGLLVEFTKLALLTVGPVFAAGFCMAWVSARLILGVSLTEMLPPVLIGMATSALLAVPGWLLWRLQFRQRVLRPLRDLGNVLIEAGKGDLTVRAVLDRQDEIGLLAVECNRLIESLAGITTDVRGSAEKVFSSAVELSASSQEMSSVTVEISSSVQQIAQGSELQSRRIEETATSIEAIDKTTGEVADQAEEASHASEEVARAAIDGQETTKQAILKIGEVQQAIETLAESVDLLGKRGERIGSIVDVITSIADQTNLLSLNAAIEAARAGESGRGFSVVAEEVRKLAEGSGKAAEEIGQLIKEVQEETAVAVRCMEIGTCEVEHGSEVVGRTGDALQEIIDAVSRTASMVERIRIAMKEQAERTSAVDKAMRDITAVVEQSASSAEQTAAATEEQTACMEEVSSAAQELSDMARQLDDSVHIFKVD